MASNHFQVRQGSTATASGRELLDTLETIGDAFGRLKRIFDAMTQQKDGATGTATDYVTPANIFGVTTSVTVDTLDSTVMQNAYNEINAFIGNGGPSLTQCCAKFKQ